MATNGSYPHAWNQKEKREKIKRRNTVFILVFVAICLLIALLSEGGPQLWQRLYQKAGIAGGLENVEIPQGATAFHFIDVGQGDATLIQCGDAFCLIDAGTRDAEDALLTYLKSAGVKKLALLVMTHPHADHIGSMAAVMETFPVEHLLLPDTENDSGDSALLDEVLQTAEEQKIPTVTAQAGQTFLVGDGALTVLYGGLVRSKQELEELGADYRNDAQNDASLITRFSDGTVSLLSSGDAEKAEEAAALETGVKLRSTVFQAGHHGSSTSNTEDFLRAIDPEIVVVSCGANNSYGHPHSGPMERFASLGAKILRTDLQGSVVLVYEGRTENTYVEKDEENAA